MKQNRTEVSFVVNGLRCKIVLEIRGRGQKSELSLSGDFDGGCGQINGRLRQAGSEFSDIKQVCDAWDRWHLKHIPARDLAALRKALARLDGKRLGHAPPVEDAPEVDGDVMDSRDIIIRIEIYHDAVADLGIDPCSRAENLDEESLGERFAEAEELLRELNALRDLEEQVTWAEDWSFGETLIRDSYFEDYAQQTAKDTGAIQGDCQWPYQYIDWEAAADALKQDYARVTYKGDTYWIRG